MGMNKEFLEFMQGEEEASESVRQMIQKEIQEDLRSFKFYTFTKFIFIQALSALMTLAICPQFGVGPIGGGHGIGHYFMQYGQWACASFCGVLFIGFSSACSFSLLKRGEKVLIFKHQLWLVRLIASVQMLFLMGIGSFFEFTPMFNSPEFNSIWWLSSVLSSFIMLKLLFMKRLRVVKI